MKSDDILRGLEYVNPLLAQIRRRCPFVGYDQVRRAGSNSSRPNEAKTTLSMAVAIRTWHGSEKSPTAGPSSSVAAEMLNDENTKQLSEFYSACFEAWGGDKQNFKLWGALNLAVTAWLYRRVVLGFDVRLGHGGAAAMKLNRQQFVACMMALSADSLYSQWLVGRGIGSDRDRVPCFTRVKAIFARRLADQGLKFRGFPTGDWQRS